MNFKQAYGWLIAAGYSPMPIRQNSKAAIVKGWQKFCASQPSEEDMASWSTQTQAIALCMSPEFGEAIDIDIEDAEILAWAADQYKFPAKRGAKGMTLFCRLPKGYTKTKINDTGLDILTTGAYTITPPTTHPATLRPYEWTLLAEERIARGLPPLPPVKELPEVSAEFLDELRAKVETFVFTSVKNGKSIAGIEGRDNELTKYTYTIVCDAIKNTNGPIDTKRLAAQIIDHDASVNLNNPKGIWYRDPNDAGFDEPQKHAETRVLRAWAFAVKNGIQYTPPIAIDLSATPRQEEMAARILAMLDKEVSRDASIPSPEELKRMGHALLPDTEPFQAIKRALIAKSGNTQPDHALVVCAAVAIGAVFGSNRFCINGVTWPNLYLYCLAESGIGKSWVQGVIASTIEKVQSGEGIDKFSRNLVGFASYDSVKGVIADAWDSETNTVGRRTRLDIMDEIAVDLIGNMLDGGAQVAAYKRGLMQQLCKVFSAADKSLGGGALKNGKAAPITNLAISFVGFTVPEHAGLFKNADFHSSGMAARGLYFFSQRDGKNTLETAKSVFAPGSRFARQAIKNDSGEGWIKSFTAFIAANPQTLAEGEYGGKPGGAPFHVRDMVPSYDDDLAHYLDEQYAVSLLASEKEAESGNPEACRRIARKYELSAKLAIVRACLECRNYITKEDFDWGMQVWEFSTKCLLSSVAFAERACELAEQRKAMSEQSMHALIVDYCRKVMADGKPITRFTKANMKRSLSTKLRVQPTIFEEAWRELLESKALLSYPGETGAQFKLASKNV